MRRLVAALVLAGTLSLATMAPGASAQVPGLGCAGGVGGLGTLGGFTGLGGFPGLGALSGIGGFGSSLGGIGSGLCPGGLSNLTLGQLIGLGLGTSTTANNVTRFTFTCTGTTVALTAGQSLGTTTLAQLSAANPNLFTGATGLNGIGGLGVNGQFGGLGTFSGLGGNGLGVTGALGTNGLGCGALGGFGSPSPFGPGIGSPIGGFGGLGSFGPSFGGLGGFGGFGGLGSLTAATVNGQVPGAALGNLNCTPQGAFLVCR